MARATARSSPVASSGPSAVSTSAQRRFEPVAVLGDARVDVALAADDAQLGSAALIAREHLVNESLDPLVRLRGALEERCHRRRVGWRDDLHRDVAAGRDELVERAEVAVDGAEMLRRHGNELVPG